jgi:hypothetical protein
LPRHDLQGLGDALAEFGEPAAAACCVALPIMRLPGSTSCCPGSGSDPKSPPLPLEPPPRPWPDGYVSRLLSDLAVGFYEGDGARSTSIRTPPIRRIRFLCQA